jgi:hypothetical protein
MAKADSTTDDLEAVRTIVVALEKFQRPDQQRILRWAQEKLGIANFQASPASMPASTGATGAGARPASDPSTGPDDGDQCNGHQVVHRKEETGFGCATHGSNRILLFV